MAKPAHKTFQPGYLDCVITVPAGKSGNSGRKSDAVGPVRELCMDSDYMYRHVRQHVANCARCDPAEALRVYLARRLSPAKLRGQQALCGMTSGGLCKLALQYERLMARTGQQETALVNEFLWRGGLGSILENASRLSTREIFEGLRVVYQQPQLPSQWQLQNFNNPKLITLLKLAQQKLDGDFTDQVLEDLVSVAEVMFE